jgi:hypothetical protein
VATWSPDRFWAVVKDVVLTGTGVWIIVSQVLSSHPPSDPLLVVAMGLCAPAIYDHAKSVISGPGSSAHHEVAGTPDEQLPGTDPEPGPGPSSSSAPPSSPPPP